MEQSQSSSGSSAHYASLLGTISELRGDLERTVTKLHNLEDQNKTLQSTYNQLKDELIDTRKKYNEAKENYLATVASKIESERQQESFLEKLRYQLAEKTKEFEQLRDKFAPQDLDYIRIKVQEELEVPHRQRLATLESDIEKHKEMYFSTKRELERCKVEIDTMRSIHERELCAVEDESRQSIAALRRQVSELQNREYNIEKDEKIRSQWNEINCLQATIKTLEEESSKLRVSRDEALSSIVTLQTKRDDQITEFRARAITAETDKIAAEQQLAVANNAREVLEATARNSKLAAEELDKSLRQLKQTSAEKEAALRRQISELNGEIDNYKHIQSTEKSEQAALIDALESRVSEREETVRNLQRQLMDMQLRSESIATDMRRTYLQQVQEQRQSRDALELEVAELRDQLKCGENAHQQAAQQYNYEIDKLKSEVQRLNREKDILHSHIFNNENKYNTEKTRLTEQRKGAEEAFRVLRLKHISLETEVQTLKKQNMELSTENKSVVQKIESMKFEHKQQLDTLERESEKRYESLGQTYRSQIEELKGKVKKAISKERKRGDTYKEHAMEAQRRGKALTGAALAVAAREGSPSMIETI